MCDDLKWNVVCASNFFRGGSIQKEKKKRDKPKGKKKDKKINKRQKNNKTKKDKKIVTLHGGSLPHYYTETDYLTITRRLATSLLY